MSAIPPLVVLDTVVFVQALISGRGPSARCIERLRAGRFILLLSDAVRAEMHEVPLRRELTCRYPHLTSERVANFYAEVESLAILIPTPPKSFALSRDPDDEIFIDLAVAGAAEYIVTWNARHLTYLTKSDTAEAKDFRTRFPGINILSPPEFLALLDAEQT